MNRKTIRAGTRWGVALVLMTFLIGQEVCAQNANAQQQSPYALAQTVANYFASIKTMTGDFVQFGPKGDVSRGTFYMERPGKVRFSYDNSNLRVISDGRSVAINNRELDSWALYQLSQTPMKMLLDNQINLGGGQLIGFSQKAGNITMVLADRSLGRGQIQLIFDPKTYALRQWTVIDQQNLATTVQISNVRTGVRFAKGMFTIPYDRISMNRRG
ncbi:LolA family protein [Bartonella sp. DGB2]|uniref:LolA family protein n=1 Tax=Bartonella sp. DGB2 TaxID=3388426 RepID=UPI00398FBBBC